MAIVYPQFIHSSPTYIYNVYFLRQRNFSSLSPRYFLRVPPDLNRLTLHFRKRKEITDEEEEEEGGGQLTGSSAQDYGMGKTKYWGINLRDERAYTQEPDKAFKFYLGTLLILFLIVYAVQAIMVHK